MSDYETNTPAWSKRQADLLRRHAEGKPVNPADIDWPHIIEGVEAQGQIPNAESLPSLIRDVYRTLSGSTRSRLPRIRKTQDVDEDAAAELLESIDRSLEAIARYGDKIDARLAEIDAIRANMRG